MTANEEMKNCFKTWGRGWSRIVSTYPQDSNFYLKSENVNVYTFK